MLIPPPSRNRALLDLDALPGAIIVPHFLIAGPLDDMYTRRSRGTTVIPTDVAHADQALARQRDPIPGSARI